ncbi:elongation factor P maturation arginine rhamnosyltransferase EarP [Methylobacterium sp. WL7]|jgi:hypothetical protein|uniref:elongation factor P maturation arginine rhamnosyltransferase EarP n=1 Tax=Methylobacterium sp. WL7 TaxID=2603900 RepID=UPI0011C70E3C|nr:elongation factor P maturation arginine rhamnosyltransferase EarP [Methylobacterium sp. WL7]TXN47340.1 elongation factor P maturation arginine rhamnosyltransferase EarP [Methylobacterium sp. WL7]
MAKHCDEYIDDETQPECLRRFLDYQCRPAALKYPTGDAVFDKAIEDRHGLPMWRDPVPTLFADCDGERVRVTMASRFGDVGVTTILTDEHGYDVRVPVDYLSDFSATAPEPKEIVTVGGIGIPLRRMGLPEVVQRMARAIELTTEVEVTYRRMSPLVSMLAGLREAGPNRKARRAAEAKARRQA